MLEITTKLPEPSNKIIPQGNSLVDSQSIIREPFELKDGIMKSKRLNNIATEPNNKVK